MTQNVPRFLAQDYPVPTGDSSMRVGRRNVVENLEEPNRLLLDVRSPEEYTGKRVSEYTFPVDHGAERTGRIPGAVHLYFKNFLNEDDSFKSPDEIRYRLLLPAEPSRHHSLAGDDPSHRLSKCQDI